MRHHMTWTPADVAKLTADVARLRAAMAKEAAAHKATRAKILAALSPAHKAYLANLVGQLAIAANPDPDAATAKLDKILTASEKSKILAIHSAAIAQMMSEMKTMMTTNSSAPTPGEAHRVMMYAPNDGHMTMRMRKPMTAGAILMHMAGGAAAPMRLQTDAFGGPPMPMPWGRHSHPMIPATAPLAPVTPAPQATP